MKKMIDCRNCGGTGTRQSGVRRNDEGMNCPACKGTGREERPNNTTRFAAYQGGVAEYREIPAAQAAAAKALEGVLDQPIIWRWDSVVYEGGLMANTTTNVRILIRPNGFVSLRPTV